jgi:hypothetical protein
MTSSTVKVSTRGVAWRISLLGKTQTFLGLGVTENGLKKSAVV